MPPIPIAPDDFQRLQLLCTFELLRSWLAILCAACWQWVWSPATVATIPPVRLAVEVKGAESIVAKVIADPCERGAYSLAVQYPAPRTAIRRKPGATVATEPRLAAVNSVLLQLVARDGKLLC